MTRGDQLRKALAHPGKPSRQIDDELHREYLAARRHDVTFPEWLAERVEEAK